MSVWFNCILVIINSYGMRFVIINLLIDLAIVFIDLAFIGLINLQNNSFHL